ncbi:hypothetical protein EM59_020800 [Vibrio parahaemolyticus]|uniref:hypothetical protein n=1 Tax=Vibrio parahaemolyticus TaxID=670 RepID=UPI0004D98C75|nr:hypothetical protein [Vibrio parahaemolyticus]ELS3715373.1 hypothetical protein [Vibrio fluvialis]EGQ9979828.1 hypothetical protein [Vibrio parahaemolyticus]ELB2745727.1 hypothetical protein [Vibrio parahaemolyticus]ELX9691612.1 hypothetical protein [Vibrio fluvialis]MEA5263099.1 hypothetical protein [Vibrio parahaemolyticus]
MKKQYVNKLKHSLDVHAFDNFKKHSDDVGLDYGAGVHSYGQVLADDILSNYVEWYSYFDDSALAEESFRKAHDDSKVWCDIELTEDELKDVVQPDLDEVRLELSKSRKTKPHADNSNVQW